MGEISALLCCRGARLCCTNNRGNHLGSIEGAPAGALFFEIKDPIGLVVLYMKNGCRPSRDGEAISSNRRSDSASIDVLLTGLKRRTECVIY